MVDIIDSVQLDTPGSALIDLFEIDMGTTTLYFYPGLENAVTPVYFPNTAGTVVNEYLAIPIEIQGIEFASDGAQARPSLSVANIVGAASGGASDTTLFEELSALGAISNSAFLGKKLTRRRTLAEHLVAQGAPPSIPNEFPINTFVIDRIASENSVVVNFELASPLDVEGVKVPGRVVVGKYCSWKYQGYYDNPSKGGCPWKLNSKYKASNSTNGGSNTHSVFFDEFNRPCVATSTTAGVWSGNANMDDIKSYGGEKYRCNINGTTTAPSTTGGAWQILVQHAAWNSSSTYSYVANPIYRVFLYNDALWTPKRYVPANTVPYEGSSYWRRIDICGKTLSSCKLRFQFRPISASTSGTTSVPSYETTTEKPLPFGGYPGTLNFR